MLYVEDEVMVRVSFCLLSEGKCEIVLHVSVDARIMLMVWLRGQVQWPVLARVRVSCSIRHTGSLHYT